ncbi:MAG TPA: Ku protein [Longimicrobiales bacterium]|nr:Ku protein [Longimicrobiales bacterium]
MPELDERAIRSRAFWSGTISFGLVSIPVNLFSANRSSGVSLRMLAPDGTPLARRYYDPETDREVASDQIIRGYEVAPGEFVTVTDEELEALEPEKTRDIDLRRFVERDSIDPRHFERAYFLTPAGNTTKAYRLLAATMEQTGRAGIATFVMRTREYLVAILAENGILRAETLRFSDELRSAEEIGLPDAPKVESRTLRSVREAVRKRTRDEFDESELEDRYSRRILELVESKRRKKGAVVKAPGGAEPSEGADVIDLMEVLKRSLQQPDAEERASTPRARTGTPTGGDATDADLDEPTRDELYERARELDIPGRSGMKKQDLIRALRRSA